MQPVSLHPAPSVGSLAGPRPEVPEDTLLRTRGFLIVLALWSPWLAALAVSMWKTPFPVNETVALLEDVQKATRSFFDPTLRSWYRPLYFTTYDWLLRGTGSIDGTLVGFRILEIAAPLTLVVLLMWHLRPRTLLEAGAATCAVAVLVGTPGLRENLEIPLLMTLVGMPLALIVWMLLTRAPRPWHGLAIVVLTLVAIGYKEQGLAIAPVVVVAWWTRAPGAGTRVTVAVVASVVAYLAFRVAWSQNWPVFEQAVGLGFQWVDRDNAIARFGAFPYWMYAYNAMSTILNVLFSEPTSGMFIIAGDVINSRVEPWEIVHVVSSVSLTVTIAWWAVRVIPGLGRDGWSPDGRVALAFIAALLGSGALAYLYSRDRHGGMAAVFYALAAYAAVRHLAVRVANADATSRSRLALAASLLAVVTVTWHARAIGTLEWTRRMSQANSVAWLVQMPQRRVRFADRDVYLATMNHMFAQGTASDAERPTNYPRPVSGMLLPR